MAKRYRPLTAGDRRHRIRVQSGVDTNTKGQIDTVWTTDARRWARIEQLPVLEQFEGQRVQGRVTHRVTLPYYPGLTTSNRFQYDERGVSQTMNIDSLVNPAGRDIEHVCMCVEEL